VPDKREIEYPLVGHSEFHSTEIKFDGNNKCHTADKCKIYYGNDLYGLVILEFMKFYIE
jgi:hypothetical protein